MSPSSNNFILRKNKCKPCGLKWTPLCLLSRQINNCLVKDFLLCFYGGEFYVWSLFTGLLSPFYELFLPSGKFQLRSSMSHLWPFVFWAQKPAYARLVPMTGKHSEKCTYTVHGDSKAKCNAKCTLQDRMLLLTFKLAMKWNFTLDKNSSSLQMHVIWPFVNDFFFFYYNFKSKLCLRVKRQSSLW